MKIVSEKLANSIFDIQNEDDFNAVALQLFEIHATQNPIYERFLRLLKIDPKSIEQYKKIPCLPIQFFKSHAITLTPEHTDTIFKSSGTTLTTRSQHLVSDVSLYEKSFLTCFEKFYGRPEQYHIIGLLPSYLEQGESSLIYMVDTLIKASKSEFSGFYFDNYEALQQNISTIEKDSDKPIFLLGVTYALLAYTENGFSLPKNTIVMETGGMKGRRKEMTKAELYALLKEALSIDHIHSEYGMTELLSQAYSKSNNQFNTPAWMKVLVRNPNDYRQYYANGKTGGINVIDLANAYSCPFIATDDLGKINDDGTFEVLGRFDHSDLRGCNLLIGG